MLKTSEHFDNIRNIKINNTTKIAFLLGAGASAPSSIPTVNSLLPELWKRAKKIGREDLDNLANFCEEREIKNIEDLLTAAYISNFAVKNGNVNSLLGYFLMREEQLSRYRFKNSQVDASSISFLQDTLQTLFGLLASTMISAKPNPTHDEIATFVKTHPESSIITTNYDGCMDEAIIRAGMKPKTYIEEGLWIKVDDNIEDLEKIQVDLIKMHGSINWSYCDSCQEVKEFDLLFLKETYDKDKLSYPVMGLCKNCGGLSRPLLVPPLSFKILMFPKLIDIWNSAREKIEKAEYLIVVGYSFAEADTYITKIMARSMAMKDNQKMIVVNTDPNLVAPLRNRFEAQINGFDSERIIRICESSDTAMEKLLRKMTASKANSES
jgi:NAD-dependent SIR2 family protein deacetylase